MADNNDNDKALRVQAASYLAEISSPLFLLDVHFLSAFTLYLGKFSLEFQKQNLASQHNGHQLIGLTQYEGGHHGGLV
jgi:hypothetical protein